MSGVEDALIDAVIERLDNWPSNGKPPMDDTTHWMIQARYVEERSQMKNCRECGTPQVDWRYLKITPAGRAFQKLAKRKQS